MTRHGQRGELDHKINAMITEAQYEQLAKAANQRRVNISTILRWLIDDHADSYVTSAANQEPTQ